MLGRALAEHPNATVTVVTSNYHTRRTRWAIGRVLDRDAERVRFVSVPTDYFDADCWWRVEEGFATYMKEYLKLPFYWVRYGWGGVWIGGAAVLALWFGWRRNRKRLAASTTPGPPSPLAPG